MSASHNTSWTPDSWKRFPVLQQPRYPDPAVLDHALTELSQLPPLVTSWEIESLKSQLADAAEGRRFLLQGGDCAEMFDECRSSVIAAKLKILLQMSLVLTHGGSLPVIRVGRIAGQYAKPRSDEFETRGDVKLDSYRGDLVNGLEFHEKTRAPDPQRLIEAYSRSALTLNFIRSLVDGGFADLHHPEYWDLDFVQHSPLRDDYQKITREIGQSLRFMETLAGAPVHEMRRTDFFTSHEGLVLAYEQAQTRTVPHRAGWWDLSTHMPWIGYRTAEPGNAHIEFFRGIQNPVAVKVGPGTKEATLLEIIRVLNPTNEPGRLTLIHRFGTHEIAKSLPPLIDAVAKSKSRVLWVCDPMHGNTQSVALTGGPQAGTKVKTRKFAHILAEIEQAFEIHKKQSSRLGGVHFELTGENVTECTGGARGLEDGQLSGAYRSRVDPRLNYEQSLEMAMLVAKHLGG
ncbi:MAG: 3-deoxy-7-phosphoheptulonate synthase class II [Planctomycetes bacterium]|nr:3-deoxy-7-phosphoheptulonate synthase class II [Planctomycetota bacterium]